MKLLHIIATPRIDDSNTLGVSNSFIDKLKAKHNDLEIEELPLFAVDLPAIAGDNIEAKYTLMTGQPIDSDHRASWQSIESLIGHFMAADIYLISCPMWNFSIPYALKYYIDAICQPGYLFRYNEQGAPEGMVHGKKMVCITSRGGDYSENSPFHAYDFQEPYLRAVFGFVGIGDITFVNVQPMDITLELRQAAVAQAKETVSALVAAHEWVAPAADAAAVDSPELKPKPL